MVWWKRHAQFGSLDESPLSIRRHYPLVGHDPALEFTKTAIAEGKAAVIFGPAGLGKSTLAKHLTGSIKDHRVVLLNAKKHAGEPFTLKRYLKKPLFSFPRRPTCLLVDEANLLAPSMVDRLFYYFDEAAQEKHGIRSLLLFQVDKTLKNASLPNRTRIGSTHQLWRLDTPQLHEIVHARLDGVDVIDEDALLAIILREGHNPRGVLLRLDALLDRAPGKVTLDQVENHYQEGIRSDEHDKTAMTTTLDAGRLVRADMPFHVSDLQHAIVRHLLLADQGSVSSIADAIGNPYGSVGKQLHLLHKKGIVAKKGASRPVQYFLCHEIKEALMTD